MSMGRKVENLHVLLGSAIVDYVAANWCGSQLRSLLKK
mgnify:CR=1 FL=1